MFSDPYVDPTMNVVNKRYGRKQLEQALIFNGDINLDAVTDLMNEQIGYMRVITTMVPNVDFGVIINGRKTVMDNLRLIEEVITETDASRMLYFKIGNIDLTEYQLLTMHRLRESILETGAEQ